MKVIDLREERSFDNLQALLPRPQLGVAQAVEQVRPLMDRVRTEGAPALYDLDEQFDGVRPASLRVPRRALKKALAQLDPQVRHALEVAIGNARVAHRAQLPEPVATEVVPGGTVYQRYEPVGRVGLYVPGGLAVYPSSVVMNVVPAQVAGVQSLVVASPPQKHADDPDFVGLPHPTILAACELLGVAEVITVGGAQAIAAMAYGFEDEQVKDPYVCAPVDTVTGPGNIYVAAAKRVVQDVCGIDSEAGTTEIAVLADSTADPTLVAWDLISQAEHDPAAACVLVTDSEELGNRVQEALPGLVEQTLHSERIGQALSGEQSAIVLTKTLKDAVKVVEAYAPEHLEVVTKNALELSMTIRGAGAIFVGDYSPVPLGDYVAGSNHVLPTGGTARYASGLNVMQFLRSVQIVDYSQDALASVLPELQALAQAEGLPAHGQAAAARMRAADEDVAAVPSDPATRLPLRAELSGIEPYGAPVIDVPVRLNVNENPFPPSEEVIDSITDAVREVAGDLNRYADRDAMELRTELAQYVSEESGVQVTSSQVWAANGSNEVMLQLLMAFGGPGRLAMAQWPTYSMYPEYARDTNTEWRLVGGKKAGKKRKKLPRFSVSKLIAAMYRHRPAVVFVPNPNNPTGAPVAYDDLKRILEAALDTGPASDSSSGVTQGAGSASIVIVDEAYAEFRDPGVKSALSLLDRYPNLVVTRTLSKAFAAAGLRIGYLIASRQVVDEVMKVRLPYHLSMLTQAAAVATLKHADTQLSQVALIREERKELAKWLADRGLTVSPSASNFLMFGPLKDPHETWEQLVERGVLVRELPPTGYLRVTVGTPSENETFKLALQEVLP